MCKPGFEGDGFYNCSGEIAADSIGDNLLMLGRHNTRYMYRPSTDQYTILNRIITLPYMCLCAADINECLTNNGSCHGCSNTDGSYDCFCNSGFRDVEYGDGVNKTCIGKGH